MARDTASAFAKWISEAVNTMSGGTKYQAGAMSPTPDQIDYLVGQVTGGVGRELSKTEQTVTALITGEDLPPHKVPLMGRFYGNAEAKSSQGNSFYAALERINAHEAEIRGRARDGLSSDDYIEEHPEAKLIGYANGAQRAVSFLRSAKRQFTEQGDKAKVKEIEERMATIMRDFNERVSKTQKAKEQATH